MYRSASSSFQPRDSKQSNKVQKDIKGRKPFSLYISGNGDNQSDSSNKKNNNSNSDNRFLSSINIDPKNHTTTITRMDTDQKNSNKSSKSKNASSNNKSQNKDETNHSNNNITQAQQNLGIPSNASYINIDDAKNVVNQSNGLTVTPTQTFNSNGQKFTSGKTVTLNGDQALAYAKGGGSNQHQLLSSFVSKNSDIKSFLTPGRIKELSSYTKTNLSPDDISQLYQHYRGALQNIQYK